MRLRSYDHVLAVLFLHNDPSLGLPFRSLGHVLNKGNRASISSCHNHISPETPVRLPTRALSSLRTSARQLDSISLNYPHETAMERTYQLAVHAWNTYHDAITIRSIDGSTIALFPVPFIRTGGNNTWRFVLEVVNQLIDPDPRHPGVLKDDAGGVLDLEAAPLSGVYLYARQGSSAEDCSYTMRQDDLRPVLSLLLVVVFVHDYTDARRL